MKRILVVDNSPLVLNALVSSLASLGHTCVVCSSGEKAIGRLKDDPASFDLVITGMRMPGMTGRDLMNELRVIKPEVPVILASGTETPESAMAMGFSGFLSKPVGFAALSQAIVAALASN